MAYINWWWQFRCKDGWTPDSIIKFGCHANMRSIFEGELCKICVGSFMTWCNPNCDVTFSNAFPWEVVLSLQYQHFGFALKSPIATRRKGFFRDKVPEFNSKLSINVWRCSCDWLSDLYRPTKVHSLSSIFNSEFIHSFSYWMSKTLKNK